MTFFLLSFISFFLSSCHFETQGEYLERRGVGIDPDYIREFEFLVKNQAFYRNQIHFMTPLYNNVETEDMIIRLRELGWNATKHKVRILDAEDSGYITVDGKYRLCRILKIEDIDDNVHNYRAVINLRQNPFTEHRMYALPPTPGYWFYCCHARHNDPWIVDIIKLDMNIYLTI